MHREHPHFPREPPALCFVTFGIAGRSLRISECSGPDLKRGQPYLQNTSQSWLQEHVTPLNAMPGTLPVPRKEYHCHHTLATQRVVWGEQYPLYLGATYKCRTLAPLLTEAQESAFSTVHRQSHAH